MHWSSYYNAHGLFVCLFPIQISAASRFTAKRAMHTEGCLGHVLRGPVCMHLYCGRRTCKVLLGRGTGKTPFYSTPCSIPSQQSKKADLPALQTHCILMKQLLTPQLSNISSLPSSNATYAHIATWTLHLSLLKLFDYCMQGAIFCGQSARLQQCTSLGFLWVRGSCDGWP